MSAADRFAEFRQEKESADKGHTSRSSTNRPVNFGDYESPSSESRSSCRNMSWSMS